MNEEQLQLLWDLNAKDAGFTDYNEFKTLMGDSTARKTYFDATNSQLGFTDYSEFENLLGLGGAQEVSAQGSAGTSQPSGRPSGSSAEPLQGNNIEPNEEIGQAVAQAEASVLEKVGNQYGDLYIPEGTEVVTGLQTDAGQSVAVRGEDGEIYNVIPEVSVNPPELEFTESVTNTAKNIWTRLQGFDDRMKLVSADTWENILGKEAARAFYNFSFFGMYDPRDIDEVRSNALSEIERLENETRRTRGIIETLSKGDLVGFGASVLDAMGALVSTAVTAGPMGVGLIGDMSGQALYDHNSQKADELGLTIDELYEQGKSSYGTPIMFGVAGGLLERVGYKGAQKAVTEAFNSSYGKAIGRFMFEGNKEGITEWLQTGLEAANITSASDDSTIEDMTKSAVRTMFSKEGAEAYLMGTFGALGFSGVSHVAGRAVRGKEAKGRVDDILSKIEQSEQALQSPNLNPITREVIEGQIESGISSIVDEVQTEVDLETTLTTEQRNDLEAMFARQDELMTVLDDPNLIDGAKDAIRAELDEVSSNIDKIISNTPETDSGAQSPVTEESGAAVSTQTEVVSEEAASEGQYFTRDIGGEQTIYRKNEDGTASIVPDAEAQRVLAQQADAPPVSDEVSSTETTPQQEAEATSEVPISSEATQPTAQSEQQILNRPAEATAREEAQAEEVRDGATEGVQQTEVPIAPEQAETVNATLEEMGFTPEESTSFFEGIQTQEGRDTLKQERADRIRQYWQSQQNLGIASRQDPEEFARFIRDVAEYAAVSILDGSIRTAKGLAKAIGVTYDENIQRAFEQAQAIVQPIQGATVTPVRITTKEQIRRSTQGGIQGTESVEISSKKALKDQIRMAEINARAGEALGIRDTKASQKQYADKVKEYKDVIRGYIKSFNKTELFKGATVPANLVARLTDRLGKIQDTSPTAINQLMNFSEYLEKLVDDIEYDNKATQARAESKRIVSIAKGLKQQRDLQGTLKRFAALGANPTRISDIDRYNELASQAIDRRGNIGVSSLDLNAFVNEQETKYEAEQVRKQEAANEVRRQQALAHMQEIMDAEGIEGNAADFYDESTLEYRPEGVPSDLPTKPETSKAKEQLEQMVAFNRRGLPRNLDGLNSYEAEALEAMLGIPLDDLDVATLRKLNTVITNAAVNGDYVSGTAELVGRYKAGREAETWLTQFNDQMHNIVQGTSERFWSRIPTRMKLDTNQLFRAISGKSRAVGESLYEHVMGAVDMGYIRAKQFIDSSVSKALSIYDKHNLKSYDSFKVGTAVYLLNYETDGKWDSPQQAFDTKVNMIVESRDALQETLDNRRDNLTSVDRRRYERDLKHLNDILRELDDIKTPEQLAESFLNTGQKELYDHIIQTWEAKKEQTQELYQKLGVEFTESELYAPISYSNIVTSGVNIAEDIDIDSYTRPGAIDNSGKHVAARQNVTTIPTTKSDDGTLITRYLSLDAIRNFDRELSRRIVDMETIDARIKAKYLLSNRAVKAAVNRDGAVNNHENLVWKTKLNIRDLNGISGFIKDYNHSLDAVITQATRLFYRSTVGSFTQLVNQSVANIPSIIANTSIGDWTQATKLMTQLAFPSVENSVTQLIHNSSASAYARLESSAEEKMMNAVGDMENEMENSLKRGFDSVNKMVGDVTYRGLNAGDNLNTKNSWLAGYIKSLKDQGVIKKASEFTVDMLKEHVKTPNLTAAHAADGIASSINATMRRASRAETTKARSTSQRVLNALFGNPLKSFATSQNMEARLAFNNLMRNDYTGRDIQIIGGYIANIFLISAAVRYVWSLGFQAVGGVLASAIVGGDDDDDKKAEERRLAELGLTKEEEKGIKTNRKIVSMMAQGIGNVLFGSQPVWLEQAGVAAIDVAYANLIVPHFESGKSPKDRARTPIPATLFFTSTDNVFGVGVLDNYAQIYNSVEKLATSSLPNDEEAARKIQAMRVTNTLLSTGVLGADAKRLSQQTLISLERTFKDGVYNMPKSYGVIKDAVNRYGIKPIAPFNKSKLYLADKDGNMEAIVLSEDDISKINREVGKEMVNLLPKAGYGRNLDSFNKGGRSVDEMNAHMAKLKSVATPIVIQRLYGKAPISENRFNKIVEYQEDED